MLIINNRTSAISKEFWIALGTVLSFHFLFYTLIDTSENFKEPPKEKMVHLTTLIEGVKGEALTALPPMKKPEVGYMAFTFPSLKMEQAKLVVEPKIRKIPPRYYPEVEYRSLLAAIPQTLELLPWDEKALRFPCLYEIAIEGKTGSVVYARCLSDVPKRIREKAENYLKTMKFGLSPKFLIKGEVELIIMEGN